MDNRLAVSITHADGRVTRWGDDEPLAQDILQDLTFSTSIPGGFKNCTGTLLRLITRNYPDLNLFDTLRIYGPGNQTAFEGRMAQFPRSHGDSFSIAPSAVGWSAHLLDDPSFRETYIDRDLSNWKGTSLQRQLARAGVLTPLNDFASTPDASGAASMRFDLSGQLQGSTGAAAEAWYDAGPGHTIAAVIISSDGAQTFNIASAAFAFNLISAADDTPSSSTVVTSVSSNASIATTMFAISPQTRWALLQQAYTGAASGTTVDRFRFAKNIAVVGGHGLTVRNTGTGAEGLYASDVIVDIVGRTAPLLTYTTGSSGSIQPTTFVIPHLIFDQPTTGSDAISFVNAYHQWDWGVYDNKQFFFRPADPDTLTWEARLSEGARVDLEGDTADQVYNGVFVTYTDATGVQKTVGPPSAVADATDSTLADTSADNPVNAAGIPRRWALLNVSQPTNQAGATQIGYVWLAEHSLPQRRGTLTLTGTATHPTEGKVPVWRVRAGDFIRISDHPADVPRRIIETSYSHANGGVLSATLDNTVFKLESIIERALGVQMVGVL